MSFIISLFVLVSLVGGYLLTYILRNKEVPKGLALIHGLFGFIGLCFLLVASFYYPLFFYSLLVLVLAAAGGALLFAFDIIGRPLPKFIAVGHGFIAISGVVLLIVLANKVL